MEVKRTGPTGGQATTGSEPSAPGLFRWTVELSAISAGDDVAAALAEQCTAVASAGGGRTQLWIADITDETAAVAVQLGFEPYRDLWQLRCDLPLAATELNTRAFTPADADAFIEVNNAAFHWHPEQGGFTAEDLSKRMAEPWFSAEGFLLHEIDGRLAGFNWTKVHADEDPPLGEIYVIAVHPDFHGRGLGRDLTLAGMAHLHAQGLAVGMLYVEADNDPANALYRKVGFRRHLTNRAFTREIAPL